MEHRHQIIRAVIFDVYGTMLDVLPPPPDAAVRWESLWDKTFNSLPRMSLDQFSRRCAQAIQRDHDRARGFGIECPEVYWPDIACEVIEEIPLLSPADQNAFLFEQAKLWHTVKLMPEIQSVIQLLLQKGIRLGIASNAQAYTIMELDQFFPNQQLKSFDPLLCFWSFEHGFSKPDPHVFRLLDFRLRSYGIQSHEALMIGDRLDNDIIPARQQGWQTWHISTSIGDVMSGPWSRFLSWLSSNASR
jgi:FMN phosphatase YigB (HAD superfamily)